MSKKMDKVSFSLFVSPDGEVHETNEMESSIAMRIAGIVKLLPGGMIVMSTDVNATSLGIKGFAKRKLKTWYNRITRSDKVDKVIKKKLQEQGMETGWSIGNLFQGRYYSPKANKKFDEKSFSIEMRGVPFKFVKEVGKDLMKKFDQESVLLVNFKNNNTMIMD